MANEIQLAYQAGKTVYSIVFNKIGQVWNTVSTLFETYATANLANYVVALTNIGTGPSRIYQGNFPSAIVAGVYSVVAFQQIGGSAAESDFLVAEGDIQWNGSTVAPLSDTATSGQVGQTNPLRLARGTQVLNFPIYLKSATDHVTPFTSGIISGQISRDGGAFGPLQSGKFTEVGFGFYSLQALTSGDLLANTVALLFTGQMVGGGPCDPLPLSFVLQRTSGQ